MTPFKSYVPHVLKHAPNCPTSLAIDALRGAAIEMCRKSLIWREDFLVSTVADEPEYWPTIGAGAKAALLVGVSYLGRTIDPVSEGEMDHASSNWRDRAGAPLRYMQVNSDPVKVRLLPIPTQSISDALSMRLALQPSRDAMDGPDILYDDYAEDIASGALYRLMLQPGRAWSDKNAALFYGKEFERQVSNAAIRVRKSNTRARLTVRQRPLA